MSEIIVDSLAAAIILLDKAGFIKDHNTVASDFLGGHLRQKKWIDIINCSFSSRSEDGLEVSLCDGRRLTVATYSLPNQLGQIIIAQDLTQSRLLQTKISHQERLLAMGKTTAELAHQIRTPLSSALIYAEHLAKSNLSDEKRKQFSNTLIERLKTIEKQIKDMLFFVRNKQFMVELISINNLLREFQMIVSERLLNVNGNVNFVIDVQDYFITVNKESLLGCLMNVINNSIEAKKENLHIDIVCKTIEKQHLVISIRDNGPGMSEEVLHKAHEAFFTTRENGTGLGLAVVSEVIKAHQGELMINSLMGEGTEVICFLPLLNQTNENTIKLYHQG